MILNNKKYFDYGILNKRINFKNKYKNFMILLVGIIINSLAINLFFIPNKIATTGTIGLSILLSNYIKIDISLLVLIFSLILLLFGLILFGVDYGIKALLGTILFPVSLKVTSILLFNIDLNVNSLFLIVLIGSVLSGIGVGLIKKSRYNVGGFYALYNILNRVFKISYERAIMICDFIIIFISFLILGIDGGIYTAIGLYISSIVSDKIMLGISGNKAFYIITKKPMVVKDYIVNNMNKTITILNARGGYSDKKKKMLLCVIPTREYTKMKEVIKELDKDAFFLITDTYSISK